MYKSLFLLLILGTLISCTKQQKKILVFSKTLEMRHASIEPGIKAIQRMGLTNGFQVDTTEDSSLFYEENLSQYAAVVFLNTTGDVLDVVQQADFERFIQAGGGYVGVHAATDTEYDWKWYNNLAGAQFAGHPAIQEATLQVLNKEHPSTEHFDDEWTKTEEWYNFKNIFGDINVLIRIDETTYEGGIHGAEHPISWFHEYDGGRSFYTAMGHLNETFADTIFLQHLLGGIIYAMGHEKPDYSQARSQRVPEENRFVKEVLDFNLDEPMELDELPGRGVLFIERTGAIKLYDFADQKTKQIAVLSIHYDDEDGLLGLAVDPNYAINNWIYLFYSPPGDEAIQKISRFDLVNDSLHLDSEVVLITIPLIRECCHSGGSLEFGKDGLLYIGVGDNTTPFESSGFAPIDERRDRALFDAQRSASNSNDFRGKILRIKPEDDGTYSIPEGNLFPVGMPNTKPEIYVMGCRNPFRFSIDNKTGFLYWGDVGPDAGKADSLRGPAGMGEFNLARKAGNYGWPYTRGNNQAYHDYDFAKEKPGKIFDPNRLINDSPNNTGIRELPPAQESMIWYSYTPSQEFPWLGRGGVNPMAGPVFHSSDFPDAEQPFPDYFNKKLFVYEWMRDWIYLVTFDEKGNYGKAEPFMPGTEFSHPMDMIFGSDGKMYLLEYGQIWNEQNIDARLSRINYHVGNRPPVAKFEMSQDVGANPLTVQFTSNGSIDYDDDKLSYEWSFSDNSIQSRIANPEFTFNDPGEFNVILKVTDEKGEQSTTNQKILVGNDRPRIYIETSTDNEIYWDGKSVEYRVRVEDTEDGRTEDSSINVEDVKVTLSYIPEGEDIIMAAIGHQKNAIPMGLQLMNESDCKVCHAIDKKVAGPSYTEIAMKYTKEDQYTLVSQIIKGSSGIWGETMMAPHPQLAIDEVQKMVNYILSLDPEYERNEKKLGLEGTIRFEEHKKDEHQGRYILIASYSDKGNPDLGIPSLSAQQQIIFRAPKLEAESADEISEGPSVWNKGDATLVGSIVHDSYLKFENISFSRLKGILLLANYNADYNYGGFVEIREGSPTGEIMGETTLGYFDRKKEKEIFHEIELSPSSKKDDLYLVFKNPGDVDRYVLNADWILLEYEK